MYAVIRLNRCTTVVVGCGFANTRNLSRESVALGPTHFRVLRIIHCVRIVANLPSRSRRVWKYFKIFQWKLYNEFSCWICFRCVIPYERAKSWKLTQPNSTDLTVKIFDKSMFYFYFYVETKHGRRFDQQISFRSEQIIPNFCQSSHAVERSGSEFVLKVLRFPGQHGTVSRKRKWHRQRPGWRKKSDVPPSFLLPSTHPADHFAFLRIIIGPKLSFPNVRYCLWFVDVRIAVCLSGGATRSTTDHRWHPWSSTRITTFSSIELSKIFILVWSTIARSLYQPKVFYSISFKSVCSFFFF